MPMIKIFYIVLSKLTVVFVSSILLITTASAASPSFTDDFRGGLESGWEWIRELPSEWKTTSEGLEVLSNGGHLYKHRPNPSPNILVRKIDPNGLVDISVNAKVTTGSGVQGGLILYNDDDNYIKLVIEKISPPKTTHLVMLREYKGKVNHFHHELRDDAGDDEIKVSIGAGTDDTYEFDLRLVLENDRVNMYWRSPGASSWKKINESMPLPNKSGQWYAGILTSGGPSSSKQWQKYRNFSLNSEGTNTPLAGETTDEETIPETEVTLETEGNPETDDTPEVPDTSETDEAPNEEIIPETEVTPETEGNPETDDTPEVPDTSETDDTPETEGNPEVEVTSEADDTPETDDTPDVDDISLVITLNGENPVAVLQDTEYTDAGASVSVADNAEESISVSDDALTVVDTAIEGSYTVTYTATDAAGNTATTTRIVNVVETLVTAGLSGQWSLDENSELIATDQSNNGNHLSLMNMSESNWVNGQFNSALGFNGFSQDALISNATQALQTESVTLSAWINPEQTSVNWEWVSAQGDNYGLFLRPGNRSVVFYIKTAGSGWDHISTSSQSFEFNQWQHIAGSFNATSNTLKLYVDGSEVKSMTIDQGIEYSTGDGFTIGSMQGGRYFDGVIDEVRVYDSALTDEEISQLGPKTPPSGKTPSFDDLVIND